MESTKLSYTAAVIDSRLGKINVQKTILDELDDLKRDIIDEDQKMKGTKTFENIEIQKSAIANYALDENTDDKTLVTKKYVDDLIDEIDARSDVVDVVGTYEDLLSYSEEKLTENDVIKVLKDKNYDNKTSYYRYSANAKKGEGNSDKWKFIGVVDQYALASELTSEIGTREHRDTSLSQAISAEQKRAKGEEDSLSQAISEEKERAKGEEDSLSQAISEEKERATDAENSLSEKISAEQERAKQEESTITASLASTEKKISNHIANASNPHSVTKEQVKLGFVENTGDSNEPENNGTKKFTTGGAYTLKTALENKIAKKYEKPSSGIPASDLKETYVVANSNITAGVGTKITYDAKGLITSSGNLSSSDIPSLDASKITSGAFTDERIASASTWNSKQEAIGDLDTIRKNAEAGSKASSQLGDHTVKSDVPEDAIFTDTTYTAGTNITIKNNVISATDTTYSEVTDSSSGLMTSSQKTKLEGIAPRAQVNVQGDWSIADMTSDAYIKNKPALSISNGKITIGENSITPITSLDGYAKTSDLDSYAAKDHAHEATLASSSETGTSLSAGSTYKLTAGGDSVIFKMPEAGGIEVASDTNLGGIKTGYSESGKNYAVKISDQKAYVTVPWSDTTYEAGDNVTISDNRISASDTHYESTLYVGTGLEKDATTENDNTKITLVENNSIRASAQITGEYPIQVSSNADKKITIDYAAPRIFMYYVISSSTTGYANNAILTNYTSDTQVLGSSTSYLYLITNSGSMFTKPLSEFRFNDILIPYYSTTHAIWRVMDVSGSGSSTELRVRVFHRPDAKWTGATFSSKLTGYTDSSLQLVTAVSGGTYGTFVTFHGWEKSQMGSLKIMKTNSSSDIDNEDEYCANMATGEDGYWGAQMLSTSAMVPAGETYYLYAKKMDWVTYSYIPLKSS